MHTPAALLALTSAALIEVTLCYPSPYAQSPGAHLLLAAATPDGAPNRTLPRLDVADRPVTAAARPQR